MKKSNSIKQNLTLKGIYKFTKAKLETAEHFNLNNQIQELRDKGLPFLHLVEKLHSICKTEVLIFENLVPTTARTMIANNLTSASPTHTMKITHCALGTSSTSPANSDTQLGTETYRNAIASITNASNVAYATGFFTALEVTGTFAEAGIFSNGTGTANSGVLLSHVALSVSKSNTETLTLDWTLTIS